MNTETPTREPRRRVDKLAALVIVGALSLTAAGCQSAPRVEPTPVPTSAAAEIPAGVRPAGVGPRATADQIERALAYRRALVSERYAGQPADRIVEQLERDRDASRGFTDGCLSYRLVEHPAGGWHVVCVEHG